MQIETVAARLHRPEEYRDTFAGYKALRLVDETGHIRGELVWRLATGQTVEITEFGIYDPSDRRQGLATTLLDAGLDSMRAFFADKPYALRRVYLFCEETNAEGCAFYEARGFSPVVHIPGLYVDCDAMLYVRDVESEPGS